MNIQLKYHHHYDLSQYEFVVYLQCIVLQYTNQNEINKYDLK